MQILVALFGSVVQFLVLFVIWRLVTDRKMPSVVLQQLEISPSKTGPNDVVVFMRGRPSGLMAFLLNLFGVEPSSRLTVTPLSVQGDFRSLSGTHRTVVPMAQIQSVSGGFLRPVRMLVGFVLLGLLGLIGGFAGGDPVAGAVGAVVNIGGAIIAYSLNKKLYVAVEAGESPMVGITFLPSVLGGRRLDLSKAMEIVTLIRAFAVDAPVYADDNATRPESFDGFEEPSEPVFEAPVAPQLVNEDTEFFDVDEEQPVTATLVEDDHSGDEQAAEKLMGSARLAVKRGQRDAAIDSLQHLVRSYPATEAAEKARASLRKSGIQPEA